MREMARSAWREATRMSKRSIAREETDRETTEWESKKALIA